MSNKLLVGLVYGGKSGEHEVSLQTAKAVIKAFDFSKYDVMPFYITKTGEWRSGKLLRGPVEDVEELRYGEHPQAAAAAVTTFEAIAPLFNKKHEGRPHVIMPLLHGTYGEDGTIQGLFEMADIPYVGAGVLASAVGMDKVAMKQMFAQAGLPQCIYRYFTRSQWENNSDFYIWEIEIALGYPCFVKPSNLGSSIGVVKAKNREELLAAIEQAFRYDRKVIVEEYVEGRELEVSVLGNDEPAASVPGEIVYSSEYYDYAAKYQDGQSRMLIPADVPPEVTEQLRGMAVRAFQAIDGCGLSRVDFFLRKSDGALLINEINTMPGFTPFSMYPLLWEATGLSYRELLDRLIELALERYNEKKSIVYGLEAE